MSFFTPLTNKIASFMLRTDAGKAAVQKSFGSWVQAFLRGDDVDDNGPGDSLRLPFKNSVWVQRAIKRVAEPICAVPLDFYELDPEGKEKEIVDPALTEFWEAPGIDRSGPMDRADFIEATVGWLKLQGESFWILDDTWLTQRFASPAKAGRSPIVIARPDRMEAVFDNATPAHRKLMGWRYTDGAGQRHELVIDQVIHRKFWNPYDDLRGCSEYQAARVASEADYLAGKFSLNMNRANGDRGVFVVAKGGMPTDPQQEQITRVLREKMIAARRGDFRPVFLAGDVAIEDPKVDSPDAEFVAARLQNRHEIFIAFGVPPSMADLVANYSIGQASDRYVLLIDTCMPLANGKLSGAVEQASQLLLGGSGSQKTIRAKFNFDDHPTMQQVRAERLKSLDGLWNKGMSIKDASDYLALGIPEYPGWDINYLPHTVAPAGAPEPATPLPGENPTADDANKTDGSGKVLSIEEAFARRNDPVRLLETAFASKKERDPRRVALANAHLAQRKPVIKAFMSKFTNELMKARREVLAKLAKHSSSVGDAVSVLGKQTASPTAKAAASDFLFDLEKFKQGVLANMRKVALNSLQTAGEQLFEEIEYTDDPFEMPHAMALKYLHGRENLLAGASDEVYDRIKTQLEEGLREGESIEKLTARVKTEFNEIGKGGATRIAMTETAAVYGVARQVAMNEAGVKSKQWLTSGLPNVRPAHLAAEGQVVGVDETFEVDGEALQHPGDPAGSPGNVINCHCVSIAIASKKENAAS